VWLRSLNSKTTPHSPVSLSFTVMRRINSITEKYLQRGYCSLPVNRIDWTYWFWLLFGICCKSLYYELTNLYSLDIRHIEIKNC
jgi:hypothetical protein